MKLPADVPGRPGLSEHFVP